MIGHISEIEGELRLKLTELKFSEHAVLFPDSFNRKEIISSTVS